jgi:aerobic carbon-monoxide dehydrogenase small subunit
MERSVAFRLNGAPRELTVRTDATLLEVLRDGCGLSSVRETCGIGICGACTVLVDGDPISSCLLLAPLVDGCAVETVEGLTGAEAGRLHPIQQAFVERMGFQCSYCTPGMILSAKALLAERADPTEREIAEYLSGNLCRCGSYPQIIAAVQLAAERLRVAAWQ